MWDHVEPAQPDPILGLTEAWRVDPNPRKVNLGVGVYQDEQGYTPVLPSVKAAETALLGQESTKSYLPIDGDPEFARQTIRLVLGSEREAAFVSRARLAAAPGGTGALRVGADLHADLAGRGRRAWISAPSWPNHRGIFLAAGYETREYPYFDPSTGGILRAELLATLDKVEAGDVVVLQVGCHNPTGADLTAEDWTELIGVARRRGWLPFIDAAYLGFGGPLDEDAAPLRHLLDAGLPFMAAISYSKNMGLYRERVGALVVATDSEPAANAVGSHLKRIIRVLYSNPPAHGLLSAATVLSDPLLRAMWVGELEAMRARLHAARAAFADGLGARGSRLDVDRIRRQRGMFSFTGLTAAQVAVLRERYSIYMTADGRINVAGLTPANLDVVCDAITAVVRATA